MTEASAWHRGNLSGLMCKLIFPVFCLLCLCLASFCAEADEAFSVSARGRMKSFADNVLVVHSPSPGHLTVEITDEYNVYRRLEQDVAQEEILLHWDGLAFQGQRLDSKIYEIRSTLESASGIRYEHRFQTWLDVSNQALIFALPSADVCYVEETELWRLELRAVLSGTVAVELTAAGESLPAYHYRTEVTAGRISRISMKRLAGANPPAPGVYQGSAWAEDNPSYRISFPVTVLEGSAPAEEKIIVTGETLPQRGDPDEIIWASMRSPVTVVDIPFTSHQTVYAEPDTASLALGTLHGQTQGLSVLSLTDRWAEITAWNHEEGAPIRGWVPLEKLKVVHPQGSYGLLLDKQAQTLTVYENGKPLDTLLVCTGRMEPGELYQETAAGLFLTGWHRVDYSVNGQKYDYVIQYDGGNLLHQIPYAWGNGKKDFTLGRAYLGTKASHACIRVQAEPAAGGLNAYWLWTHIPFQTPLIILDDPEEREKEKSLVQGNTPIYDGSLLVDSSMDDDEVEPADQVVLTFGGDAVLGGRETYYSRADGFPAYMEKYGNAYPLSGLKSLLEADDWTSLNLECVLKEDASGEDLTKTWRFRGIPGYAEILPAGSVEMVNVANNHTIDYGPEGLQSTLRALEGYALACGGGHTQLISLGGHLFGFGGCRETVYLSDPGVIERDIGALRNAGAEIIIYQCHWGTEYAGSHNTLQEAMARACIRAGATVVVGHHPHVVQGIDVIQGTPVIYSLGNCLFGGTIQLQTYDGLLCRLSFSWKEASVRIGLRLIPILTSGQAESRINDYCPVPAEKDDRIRILRLIQADTPFPLHETMILDR